jgi:hypothetical protein
MESVSKKKSVVNLTTDLIFFRFIAEYGALAEKTFLIKK